MRGLILLGIFFLFSGPGIAFGERLTLEEAVRRALEHNPIQRAGEHEVSAARAARRAERGALYPRLDFLARASRFSDPQAVTPIKGPGAFPPFSRDLYLFEFDLTFPLYEGGRVRKRVRLAEIETLYRRFKTHQEALDLIANVKTVYFLGLYLEELVRVRSKILRALKEVEEETRLKLSVGRVPPLDLLRIEARVRAGEAALVRARENLKRAREALAVLMGEPPRDDLELSGRLPRTLAVPSPPAWERIKACRPDLLALRRSVERAAEEVELARRERWPVVEVFSRYGRHAGAGLHHDEEVWEAGVQMRLNLWRGGAIPARVAEARARWLAERERLRAAELEARREVSEALSALREAVGVVRHLEAARRASEEAFRVESLRYRTGAGSVTDLLEAQASWWETEAAYLEALYRYLEARVRLERATTEIARGFLEWPCEEGRHASQP